MTIAEPRDIALTVNGTAHSIYANPDGDVDSDIYGDPHGGTYRSSATALYLCDKGRTIDSGRRGQGPWRTTLLLATKRYEYAVLLVRPESAYEFALGVAICA